MTKINRLEWDSDFFNLEVGDFILKNSLIPDCSDFDLIYVKSEKVNDLEINGYEKTYTETKIIFKKILKTKNQAINSVYDISVVNYSIEELRQLAYESGKYSRFRLDQKNDPKKFFELYDLWVLNSLNKKFADNLYVYLEDNNTVGFVTYKINNDFATIGLIAVNPNYQGRGIGGKLLKFVENKLIENNIKILLIPTQFQNEEACFFYKKHGYQIHETTIINHYWKI